MNPRLYIRLIVYFFTAFSVFCLLGILGIYLLDKRELSSITQSESRKIAAELNSRKNTFISDIVLKHNESLQNSLAKTSQELGLSSLEFIPPSSSSVPLTRDQSLDGQITDSVNLEMESVTFGTLKYTYRVRILHPYKDIMYFILIYLLVFSAIFLVFLSVVLKRQIFIPLETLLRSAHPNLGSSALRAFEPKSLELNQLKNQMIDYIEIVEKNKVDLQAFTKLRTQAELAAQVSHDIRSPLAALDMILSGLEKIDNEKITIIRQSVNRIRDIANDLLTKEKTNLNGRIAKSLDPSEDQILEDLFLYPAIDQVVTEKRLEYKDTKNCSIDFEQTADCYGLFSKVNSIELKRVLSNLINNSVEAHSGSSLQISVKLSTEHDGNVICISDNGKGMEKEHLKLIGSRGITFGKQGGSGLGLFHAKSCVERWGGDISISSRLSEGTMIRICLPTSAPPEWFLSNLVIKKGCTIVVFDDDLTVHELWRSRFQAAKIEDNEIVVLYFDSLDKLRSFYGKEYESLDNAVFLMDYEVSGKSENGLNLIELLGISSQSILVTSHHEESAVISRCISLNVRLLPKPLSGFVPIDIE